MKFLRLSGLVSVLLLLGGCNVVLLSPSGDVALQQRNLLLASTGLMLLIILPVMALTLLFAWHYRAENKKAVYDPDFHHSTALEVVIWSMPLLIIVALGALTWMGTHLLDPYRSIGRISAAKPISDGRVAGEPSDLKPLKIEVVALDWKWLFFYPEQGIATVNELAAPVDVPIEFKITSTAVMNSFYIPALAGQIYAMPGMETTMHAVMNHPGVYDGFSAHYSGAGFSHMRFKFHGLDGGGFDAWVEKVKADKTKLDRALFAELERPSEAEPVRYYGTVENDLYSAIVNLCTRPGKMCMSEMMHIDANGGGGRDSEANLDRLRYDGARKSDGNEAPGATFPSSGRPPNTNVQPQGMMPRASSPDVKGRPAGASAGADPHAGHTMPGMNMPMAPTTAPAASPPSSNPAPAQLTK